MFLYRYENLDEGVPRKRRRQAVRRRRRRTVHEESGAVDIEENQVAVDVLPSHSTHDVPAVSYTHLTITVNKLL